MDKVDAKRFWLGAIIAILGIAMMFVGMFIDPKGEISPSVLGGTGEAFLLAGALLGLDSYFNFKIKKFISNENKEKDNNG